MEIELKEALDMARGYSQKAILAIFTDKDWLKKNGIKLDANFKVGNLQRKLKEKYTKIVKENLNIEI